MSLTLMGQGPFFPQLNLVYVAAKLAGMLQLELELELQCRRTWLELPALARGTGTHPAVEFPQPTCPSLIYSFPSMAREEPLAGGALQQPQAMPAMLPLWGFTAALIGALIRQEYQRGPRAGIISLWRWVGLAEGLSQPKPFRVLRGCFGCVSI